MRRVHGCAAGILLAFGAAAWAGGGVYPPPAVDDGAAPKSRAEVVAELQEAIRTGRMYDVTFTYADKQALAASDQRDGSAEVAGVRPQATFADDAIVVWGDARVMRTKIQAEAAEANRLGLLSFGEGNPPVATEEQEQMIAAAGRRAIAHVWLVGSL